MMTEAERAYIAALVDTLGKLTVRRVHRDELPVITIQGKYEILPWLAEATGVKLMRLEKAYARHQCTDHCPERHMAIESWTYRWQLVGARAVVLLEAIEPYMKLQGRLARDLVAAGRGVAFKPAVLREMRELVTGSV
jgi:hypothetical protein